MLAELAVVVVVLVMVIFVYLKGTLIKSVGILISVLAASIVTMSFFETLAKLVIGYGFGGEWMPGTIFLLLFVLVFVILNTICDHFTPVDLYFGDFPDRAARALVGAFAGFVVAGIILLTAAMLPIGTKWPYERFNAESGSVRPTSPDKSLLLNADGFVAGLTSWVSQGSMAGKKSFALFHPDFVSEIHLNRIGKDDNNLSIAGSDAISVKAAWDANSELISETDKKTLSAASGTRLVIVRAALDGRVVKEGGALSDNGSVVFTLTQFRLMCKNKDSAGDLKGSGEIIYPIGIIKKANIVEEKKNAEDIVVERSSFDSGTKMLDLVFNVPAAKTPVLLEFKQNAVAQITRLVSGENIPAPLN
ncbi:MAG: hypothetical protein WC770_06005 [Phycisphaerae bacterium]|jgi:hypothetical protein